MAIVKFVPLEPLMAQMQRRIFTHRSHQKFALFKHYFVEDYGFLSLLCTVISMYRYVSLPLVP